MHESNNKSDECADDGINSTVRLSRTGVDRYYNNAALIFPTMLAAHELTKKTKKKKKQLLTLLLNLYQHLRQKSFLFLLIMVY